MFYKEQVKIERYRPEHKKSWDDFVVSSKNGTFMHFRDFVEYHRERFDDHSLLVWNHKNKLVALLPAHQQDNVFNSHLGLTYGGFVSDENMKMPLMLVIFQQTISYLKENDFQKVMYKPIPKIQHKLPSDEDIYALFLCGAKLVSRHVCPVIDCRHKLKFQKTRINCIQTARKHGLIVRKSEDIKSYWDIVTDLLRHYNSKPVHMLEEIEYLHDRFPQNIKLFACYKEDTLIAGVLVFESDQVAKIQYIAGNDEAKGVGAIDLIFDSLINQYYVNKPFIDFGATTTNGGYRLNKGLNFQKEGFGARTSLQDAYEIDLLSCDNEQLLGALE